MERIDSSPRIRPYLECWDVSSSFKYFESFFINNNKQGSRIFIVAFLHYSCLLFHHFLFCHFCYLICLFCMVQWVINKQMIKIRKELSFNLPTLTGTTDQTFWIKVTGALVKVLRNSMRLTKRGLRPLPLAFSQRIKRSKNQKLIN